MASNSLNLILVLASPLFLLSLFGATESALICSGLCKQPCRVAHAECQLAPDDTPCASLVDLCERTCEAVCFCDDTCTSRCFDQVQQCKADNRGDFLAQYNCHVFGWGCVDRCEVSCQLGGVRSPESIISV